MNEELQAELIGLYAAEAAQQVDVVAAALEAASRATDPGAVASLRRALHTLKGGAYSAGLTVLGDLVHELEEAFPREAAPDAATLAAARRAVQALGGAVQELARTRREPAAALAVERAALRERGGAAAPAGTLGGERWSSSGLEEGDAVGRVSLERLEALGARILEARQLAERLGPLLQAAEEEAGRTGTRAAQELAQALAGGHARLRRALDGAGEASDELRLRPVSALLAGLEASFEDALRRTGKQARLELQGGDVQLDRRVAERLRGALAHLVRNAVDHGLDGAGERAAQGKPPLPTVAVRVAARGIRVELQVQDDGRGLDPQAIRRAALERGLLAADQAAGDEALFALLLRHDLSTRREATTTSGRGIGLDAVRHTVEEMAGRLRVASAPGRGTTFTLEVPVSLATSRVLLATRAGRSFAVPLVAAARVLPVAELALERTGGRRTFLFAGERVALVDLARAYRLAAAGPEALAVVVEVGDRRTALGVDRVDREAEVAVRPVGEPLGRLPLTAGLALADDGRTVPVVDLAELARAADAPALHGAAPAAPAPAAPRATTALVVDDSITTRTLETNVLRAAGWEVRTAIDGVEALEQLARGGVDLVITDYEMPRLDGLGLLRRIRGDAGLARLPVIVVSSRADLEGPVLAAGADAYVVKRAFDQEQLLDTAARLARRDAGRP